MIDSILSNAVSTGVVDRLGCVLLHLSGSLPSSL